MLNKAITRPFNYILIKRLNTTIQLYIAQYVIIIFEKNSRLQYHGIFHNQKLLALTFPCYDSG